MKENSKFWYALDVLINESEIEIDRPKGSVHPKVGLIYPVDYGYLKGTKSMDGEGIDVFVGSVRPLVVDAIICSVDLYKRDSEIKILLGCDEAEKEAVFKIYLECYDSLQGVLIRRN